MNGFIIVNKEENITSFGVCSRLRKITDTKKIGHTGTLDPMACGVLVIAVGNATKLIDYIPNHDKRYTAGIRFGLTSDTCDIWGEVKQSGYPSFDKDDLLVALDSFKGEISQTTPAYSAARYNGRHMYEYARKGIDIPLPKRSITINDIELISFDKITYSALIDVDCSKGTYIRSICDELGRLMGCGAVMQSLTRTRAGDFCLENAYTLNQIEKMKDLGDISFLLKEDVVLSHLKHIDVIDEAYKLLKTGSLLPYSAIKNCEKIENNEQVAIYHCGNFAALGLSQEEGVKPYKVFI